LRGPKIAITQQAAENELGEIQGRLTLSRAAIGSQSESASGVISGLRESVCANHASWMTGGTSKASRVSLRIWRRRAKCPPMMGCLAGAVSGAVSGFIVLILFSRQSAIYDYDVLNPLI